VISVRGNLRGFKQIMRTGVISHHVFVLYRRRGRENRKGERKEGRKRSWRDL